MADIDDPREYDQPAGEYGDCCPNCGEPMEYFQFNGKAWWRCNACDCEGEL